MINIMSSKTNSSNTEFWDQQRGVIRSRKGGWIIGQGVFSHGFSMMDDLVGKVSYMQVVILNAIGRLPERRLASWVEAVYICLSWPDPRIWCNHIGALGGTVRASAVASTVAGILAADSRTYGTFPLIEGAGFIQKALKKKQAGISVEQIVETECAHHGGKPVIMGYARPLAKGDERIIALERVTSELNFPEGEHLKLAYDIGQIMIRKFDEGMNINGYVAAFLSDQGFTPEEMYLISQVIESSGVTACFINSRDRPAGSFLPLRCDDIDYQGQPPRSLPDADKI
jgi:hypothetical protein